MAELRIVDRQGCLILLVLLQSTSVETSSLTMDMKNTYDCPLVAFQCELRRFLSHECLGFRRSNRLLWR